MNVKIARIKAGLTQEQLCKLVHISPKKLCRIENGNDDTATKKDMKNIANVLGEDVLTLFFNK
ncbi:helix-turn-helix domain-containing protein [Sedimentibacter hydroxybenzoicus DSM 7310]|uniref:Helix-turn-helix domain-containing protein n=1 Tax=Sedimentibacter hydroxybenzoicus DSM 7310 TaxID=1123245 RepID=A0A974BKH1_SEDHY|nr:helix-turn-helix transcriptional regulator [Sedimentibacter hydroxybenzoicus]NYB74838.1 helix-turn-helix domain-containing protein [Sedimentibacter hydroxybenzoicus DSM 7310]